MLGDDLYGGTYRLMEKVFQKWGISATHADVDDPKSFEKSITAQTRLIWIETPTNPLLKVIDIRRLAEVARAAKVLLAVDNTLASPYFQNPLALGADLVVHSTIKYINGHSDVIGGALVVNDEALYDKLKFHQNAAGAGAGALGLLANFAGSQDVSGPHAGAREECFLPRRTSLPPRRSHRGLLSRPCRYAGP